MVLQIIKDKLQRSFFYRSLASRLQVANIQLMVIEWVEKSVITG
ncbi:MAG: hypothetical protein R3E08_04455 [Thiotrichaceae bacterium]